MWHNHRVKTRMTRATARTRSTPTVPRVRPDARMGRVTVGRSYLYGDVAFELRRRIAQGTYAPHARIPSLSDLTREFKVSAITIRRALHELMYEGLLVGHQGLGIFVTPRQRIHRVVSPGRSFGDEIRRAGFEPRIEEMDFRREPADAQVAALLGIPERTPVYRHEKLVFADADPVSLHRLYLPEPLADTLRADLAADFIFRILDQHGITVTAWKVAFTACTLGEVTSRLFGRLPIGFPMIATWHTPYGDDGAPILTGVTFSRPDRFTMEVTVRDTPQALSTV
jgi:DNA-binding GntR family transcriptional regulator